MSGATNSGGTNYMPTNGGFTGSSAGCTGTPAPGTVSASTTNICGSGTSVLTLSGATSGSGIVYQWQKSTTSATTGFSNIAGANSLTYNTPSLSATTYYRAYTTCGANGDTASAVTITVNAVPTVAAITGLNAAPLLVAGNDTLADATAGGLWSSSNTSVVTVNNAGVLTGVAGGTAVITYKISDPFTTCVGTSTVTVNVVWPNTLALYVGTLGSSTGVIGIPGETTGPVVATSFGTPATPCGSGGISGLTVPVAVTGYTTSGPHVSYKVYPNSGQALNVFRIHAVTRESATGPSKARIAYRVGAGAWISEGVDITQSTGGGCGAASNSWDFTPGAITIMGITDSLEVAVFPYAPLAGTGTFQLNSLEVYGVVTTSTPCGTGFPAGTVTPAVVNICDSGSRFLTFTGTAGVGISYKWQRSTDNIAFTDAPGANTNASYNTGVLHAGIDPAVTYYRVVTHCSVSGDSSVSAADTVNLNAIPSAGTITAPQYLTIGTLTNLTSSVAGGWWSSNFVNSAPIDSASGDVTPILPGIAVVTYHVTVGGCTGITKDTVSSVLPNTLVAYLGTGGNSVAVANPFASATTATNLVSTGYGATTPCGNGGVSGLTNNGVTTYNAANAHTSFMVKATAGGKLYIDGFHVTLRGSNSGMQNARLAYRANGSSTWIDEGADQSVDVDDCGYSATDLYWSLANPTAPTLPIVVDSVEFAVYGFNPGATNGTIQINTVDITGLAGTDCGIAGDPIFNETLGQDLDAPGDNRYEDCAGTQLLSNPTPGGIYSSSNTSAATVNSAGELVFQTVASEIPDTVTYAVDAGGCILVYRAAITVRPCGTAKPAVSGVSSVAKAEVKFYPNPASTTLNIVATEKVNISVMSLDGKTLIQQQDAKNINISHLANGLYIIKVYNQNNSLIKTAKFSKQ